MRNWNPRNYIILGILLLVVGWAIPFLEIMQVLKSTLALNFFSFTASVAGLLLGVIGIAMWRGRRG